MKHLFITVTILLALGSTAAASPVPVCEKLIGTWQCLTHMETSNYARAARSGYILHRFKNRFRGLTTPTSKAKAAAACQRELQLLQKATVARSTDNQRMRLERQVWAQCLVKPHSSTTSETYYTSSRMCTTAAAVATCVASNLSLQRNRPAIGSLMGYVQNVLKRVPLGSTSTVATQACLNQVSGWVVVVKRARFRGGSTGTKILRKCLLRAHVLKGVTP
jgi:hypothetical protein